MNTNQHSVPFRHLTHGLIAAVAVWGVSAAQAQTTGSATAGSSSSGSAQTTTSPQLNRSEISFIKQASQDNEGEIQMGKVAAQKAQNQEVKQLAQRLEQDHSKAEQQLQQLAQTKGVVLSEQPSHKEERKSSRLENKSGSDFDKAFVEDTLKDHETDIKKFQKALQNTSDPQLRAYIESCLPVLREHLQLAHNAGTAVGVPQRTLSSAEKFLNENQNMGTAPESQTGQKSITGKSYHQNNSSTTESQPSPNATEKR